MTKFLPASVLAAFAIVLAPAAASAQIQPTLCSASGGSGCLVMAQAGGGRGQQLMLGTRSVPSARKPSGQLNTLNELFAALRACWVPPPLKNAHRGMEMTIRFSLNRDGRLIGPPRVTYATPEVTLKTRDIYREAMTRSLENCTPFPLTSGLGGAVAGRPISALIIDDRDDSAIKPRV
jgi:hypothetical protein